MWEGVGGRRLSPLQRPVDILSDGVGLSESGALGSGWPGAPPRTLRTTCPLQGWGSVSASRCGLRQDQMLVWSHQGPSMLTAGPGEVPWPLCPVPTRICPAAICSLAHILCAASQDSLGGSRFPDLEGRSWGDGHGETVMEGQSWGDGRGGTRSSSCGQRCFNLGTNQPAILPDFNF